MKQSTIIDATLTSALSSTKSKTGEKNPEMYQTKKGNQWYFGMKERFGVDKDYELIQSVESTSANVHDITRVSQLLHREEEVAYGDALYQGIEKRAKKACKSTTFRFVIRPKKRRVLPDTPYGRLLDLVEIAKAHIRAKVEYPFRFIMEKFGFRTTVLHGLA